MERGTPWERAAVREEWDAMAERRHAADRFLLGAAATIGGVLLLLLAGARETCRFTVGGAATECTGVLPPLGMLVFAVVGVFVLLVGLWACWTAVRRSE